MAWHHGYTWWMPAHQGAAEHRTLASEQLKCPFAAPITLPAQARIGALWHVTVAADRVSFTDGLRGLAAQPHLPPLHTDASALLPHVYAQV